MNWEDYAKFDDKRKNLMGNHSLCYIQLIDLKIEKTKFDNVYTVCITTFTFALYYFHPTKHIYMYLRATIICGYKF